MDKDKKFLDFIASVILLALGSYVFGYGIFVFTRQNTKFTTSAGFLPAILGGGLIVCSLMLMYSSLQEVGLKKTLGQIKVWWSRDIIHSRQTHNTVFGILLMGVYSCVLMSFLPYWLATLIMLLFLFWYLHAAGPVKSVLIAILTVAAVVGVFQYAFHVRLP